ncbi:MAG: LamG-like jellyroll fold domain-containing protein, partial [Planctomycetota bacterium]
PGKVGGALQFDGRDDHVVLPNESAFDFREQMTVAAWIKVSSFTKEWQAIVNKGDNAWRLQRFQKTNQAGFGIGNNPPVEAHARENVNDGRWHHVVGVYDRKEHRVYIDGRLGASESQSMSIDVSNAPVWIGGNSRWKGRRNFHGLIDDVRIYKRALSENEARSIHELGLMGGGAREVTAGLVGWWKLDEAGGNKAADASGRGNDGTVNGDPAFQPDGGRVGGALKLDGDGDSITIGNWDAPAFSITHWMKWDGGGGIRIIVSKDGRWDLWIEQGDLCLRRNGSITKFGDYRPPVGTWVHLVVAYDGTNATLYVNGAYEGAGRFSMGGRPNATIRIGEKTNGGWGFNGALDDVRIYDRVLSGEEVAAIAGGGGAGGGEGYVPGLSAQYFERKGLEDANLKLTRIDPVIDFSWGHGMPIPEVTTSDFSVRWTGEIHIPADGDYWFRADRDDNLRLLIRGREIIGWSNTKKTMAALEAGWAPMKVEYNDNTGGAKARLFWQKPGGGEELVSKEHFRTRTGGGEPRYARGLLAEYFAGQDLDPASRKASKVVPAVDFDWQRGAPVPGLSNDDFSCRFSGEIKPPKAAWFDFFVDADDAVSVWIGDLDAAPKVIKHDKSGKFRARLGDGWTPIRVEHKEGGGSARCKLSWRGSGVADGPIASEFLRTREGGADAGALAGTTPATPAPTASPATTPPVKWTGKFIAGLRGTYYLAKEIGPRVPSVERIDPNIDFGWGQSPGMGVPKDNFAVRWVGEIQIPSDGKYTFEYQHDDGGVLVIDGKHLIDRWNNGGNDRKDITLKKGWVPIEVLFNDTGSGANARFRWEGPGIKKGIVPAKNFRTPDVKTTVAKTGDGLPGGPKEPLPGETGKPGEVAPGAICEIFRGVTYLDRVGVRVDPMIDYHFENAPPDQGLTKGTYTLRWSGYFLAHYDGDFFFEPENLMVKIDGKPVPKKTIEMAKGLHRFEAVGSIGSSQKGPVR